MKKNNLLTDTRKTYHKVKRLVIKNGVKGTYNILFYVRLLIIRKLIIKWYYRNNYSLLMHNLDRLDYTINYGLTNPISINNDKNIKHILSLIGDFNNICEEIEDYYG